MSRTDTRSGLSVLAALLMGCGNTAAGPIERPSVPPLELSLSNEDGFIDDARAFQSSADGFRVGAGGDGGDADAFVFAISVVNQSAFPIFDIRITDDIAPHTGIALCREIPAVSAIGAANPSVGAVVGGGCSPEGFVWEIPTLEPGTFAELFFRAEAVGAGGDVNRARISAESVTDFALHEEPFLIGEADAIAELDISLEDGSIDNQGVFQSAKDVFTIGDGSDASPDELIYLIRLTNQGSVDALNLRIVDAVGPDGEGVACREILATGEGGGANPSIGNIDGGECLPSGFTWRIGTLEGGTTAAIFFRAEALDEGTPVNRVVLVGGGLPFPAVIEEPTAIVGD